MRLYLDTSILVALLTQDAHSGRADALLRASASALIVSDLATAEFASAMARLVRTRELSAADARKVFADLDAWVLRSVRRIDMAAADVRAAEACLRRLDLPLRTMDAVHIAMSQRTGSVLATFDTRMAAAARALGGEVVEA